MDSSRRSTGNHETKRGLGLAAALRYDVIRGAAAAAEENGYHSFWLNNPPGGNALASLGAVAGIATSIWLGVGVIPLAAHPPEEIARDVERQRVPLDRFYLGVGSGSGGGGVQRVEDAIPLIRSLLDCRLVIAAMGPRMCRLGGRAADGVLLNWLTPQWAERSAVWIREAAEIAGRPAPRVMAYVRVALGAGASARLEREAANYEAIPHYSAHFARMGVGAMGTAVVGDTPDEIQVGLTAWNGVVDEIVVRAITANDTIEEVTELLTAATPRG